MTPELMAAIQAYGRAEIEADRLSSELSRVNQESFELSAALDDTRVEIGHLRANLLKLAREVQA